MMKMGKRKKNNAKGKVKIRLKDGWMDGWMEMCLWQCHIAMRAPTTLSYPLHSSLLFLFHTQTFFTSLNIIISFSFLFFPFFIFFISPHLINLSLSPSLVFNNFYSFVVSFPFPLTFIIIVHNTCVYLFLSVLMSSSM